MGWKKGVSGNPRGRPAHPLAERFREALEPRLDSVINAMVDAAENGDAQAAKLLLDRCLPVLKAIDPAISITLPAGGGLAEQGRAIIAAVADGRLPANQAVLLVNALANVARISELDELEKRVTELEKKS